jgi:branched-chain amino acid transport system permease protein
MAELALLILFGVLPFLLPDYLTVFATRVLILSLLALSFDLVWGYAGILSFGQALFYGTAGYVVALMARDLEITSIFIVLPIAVLVGLVLAFLMACFLLLGRFPPSAIFIALGTLTGSYAADRLARGWYYLGGQNGIPSIPEMTLGSFEFDQGPIYYYLAFATLIVVYLLCRFLVHSQFGLALAGIREQEMRVAFFGYRVQTIKTVVFSFAGAIAGLAGGLYTFHEGFVWPNMIGVDTDRPLRAVRRSRHFSGSDHRRRCHRNDELCAVGCLSAGVADHPWRAPPHRHPAAPLRPYQPDRFAR